MNASLRCIFLLACVATCFCSTTIKRCKCISTNQTIDPKLIVIVKNYEPRPYCKKTEVIATLNDSTEVCLDPESQFTKDILKSIKLRKAARAMKKVLQKRQ